jgi:hypothetical protein
MNRRQKVLKHFPVILGFFLIIGFSFNLIWLEELKQFSPYVQLIIKNEGSQLDGKRANDLLAENEQLDKQFSFVVWGKKNDELVSVKELNTEVKTDVLALQGNSQLLFPKTPGLHGENTTECLVSSSLANKLFGNTTVKGLSIVYNNRKYQVLSVIPSDRSFFVYESKSEAVTGLDRLTILSGNQVNKNLLKQEFSERFSLDSQLLDYDIFRLLLGVINGLLLLLFLGFFIWLSIRSEKRKEGLTRRLFSMAGVTCSLVLFILLTENFSITSEYLPTQASDFDFVKVLLDRMATSAELFLESGKYASERQIMMYVLSIAVMTFSLFLVSFIYPVLVFLAETWIEADEWEVQLLEIRKP